MKIAEQALTSLKRRAQQDVEAGNIPACQYALALDGEVLVQETLGTAPVDARFSIWSVTKPIFASVLWQLMGEAKIDSSQLVVDYWPEFGANGKGAVTLEHLLLLTAGFPKAAIDLSIVGDREARARQMEGWTLEWEPGTRYVYHALSAHYVMAEVVARITGKDHRVALRERILDPLSLGRLELGVPLEHQNDVQPLMHTGEPPSLEEVAAALGLQDVPQEMADKIAGAANSAPDQGLILLQGPHALEAGVPAAGGVSDAASVSLFYQALLHNRGGLWDTGILRDVTSNIRNTMHDPALGVPALRTLGLEVQGEDATAVWRSGSGAASPATFGHGGAAGQIAWADPATGLSFAYFTNGSDRNQVRQLKRTQELSAAAAACIAN